MRTQLTMRVDEIQVTAEFAKLHGWAKFPDGKEAYAVLPLPPSAVLPKCGATVAITVMVERRVAPDPHYHGEERRHDYPLTGIENAVESVLAQHMANTIGEA